MKYLIKYLFIAVLILQAKLCFSLTTEEQIQLEENELKDTIMAPFISNYTDRSSMMRLMSLEMIAQQKYIERPFNTIKEASDYYLLMLTKKPFNDPKRMFMIDEFRKCRKASGNENPADAFSEWLQKSWQNQVADCSEYAHLVMVIFEFNQMNHVLLNKQSNFRRGLYVDAIPKTGDHSLVIIIGRSGTGFVVDPWIWTVKQLNPDKSGNILLDKQITHLYKDIYYDMLTVNKDTKWNLDVEEDKGVKKFVNTKGRGMESLYNLLKPSFPSWKSYDELFPSSALTGNSDIGNEQNQFEHKHEQKNINN